MGDPDPINKPKMLKRQMYGRAGLLLLGQRMLATAAQNARKHRRLSR